jgi:hypothetical protein
MLAFLPVLPIAGSGHADILLSFGRQFWIQSRLLFPLILSQEKETEVIYIHVMGGWLSAHVEWEYPSVM